MAQQIELTDSSIAALQGIVDPLTEKLDTLGTQIEESVKATKKSGKKSKGRGGSGTGGGVWAEVMSNLNQISLAGPGGARLFGIGRFLDAINKAQTPLGKVTVGLSQMSIAIFAATEGLRALSRSLGGVTTGQALSQGIGSVGQMVNFGPDGVRIRSPTTVLRAQGAFAGEFGGALSSGAAGTQADWAADLGLSVQEVTKLQRVFQTMGPDIRGQVDQFREQGILAQTAQKEMVKASDAIAISGDNFNEFIVEGIANSKKLGFEFMQIHKQLTGFTMDFEGTVSSFSQLRAVLPGFSADFGQLMTASLSGNQGEFIEMIRGGLAGAGVASAADLNTQQAALLQQTTGFNASQIDRMLSGEEVLKDEQVDIDKTRNSLLEEILVAVVGGSAAIVTNIGMSGLRAAADVATVGGAVGKTAVGASLLARMAPMALRAGSLAAMATGPVGLGIAGAGLAGYAGYKYLTRDKKNDFMVKDGELIDINDRDLIGMLPENVGRGSSTMEMRRQTQAIDKLVRVMSGPQEINLKNWRQAERSAMDASIREA